MGCNYAAIKENKCQIEGTVFRSISAILIKKGVMSVIFITRENVITTRDISMWISGRINIQANMGLEDDIKKWHQSERNCPKTVAKTPKKIH